MSIIVEREGGRYNISLNDATPEDFELFNHILWEIGNCEERKDKKC